MKLHTQIGKVRERRTKNNKSAPASNFEGEMTQGRDLRKFYNRPFCLLGQEKKEVIYESFQS